MYTRVALSELQKHQRAIPSKFANTRKYDSSTSSYKFKSRLVTVGMKHLDPRGDRIDVETALPPIESLRTFFAFMTGKRDFKRDDIMQADVVTALL